MPTMQGTSASLARLARIYFLPITTCALLLVTLVSYSTVYDFVKTSPAKCWVRSKHKSEVDIPAALQRQWNATIHDLQTPQFTTPAGLTYDIHPDAYRWPKMGKKLLIIDIDTRLDVGEGGMLNPKGTSPKSMLARTGGYLNHMLYAQVHGYDYRLVRPPQYDEPERSGAWVKLPVMREALKSYDVVMFLDADAIFENINLPLEWLLSHWNITDQTLVALPEDVHEGANYDDHGLLFWNAGVIIARQSERTQELFRRWENCPTEEEFKGCSKWLVRWAAEQAAFNNYIRYSYDMTEDLRAIPCNEANGNYGVKGADCQGTMVSHWWHQKEFVVDRLYQQADACTVYDLHQHFYKKQEKYFLDLSDRTYPLKDVSI